MRSVPSDLLKNYSNQAKRRSATLSSCNIKTISNIWKLIAGNWPLQSSSNAAPRSGFRLRPRRCPANGEHAREPSLLAPKVRVQPLLEIYTAEVRFTRKIVFLQKIQSIRNQNLWRFVNWIVCTKLHKNNCGPKISCKFGMDLVI